MTVSVLLYICVHVQITRGASSHYLAPYYSVCLYARAERASIVSVLLFCVSTHAVSGGERAANDCHCTIPRLCARVGHEESEQPVTVTVLYFSVCTCRSRGERIPQHGPGGHGPPEADCDEREGGEAPTAGPADRLAGGFSH